MRKCKPAVKPDQVFTGPGSVKWAAVVKRPTSVWKGHRFGSRSPRQSVFLEDTWSSGSGFPPLNGSDGKEGAVSHWGWMQAAELKTWHFKLLNWLNMKTVLSADASWCLCSCRWSIMSLAKPMMRGLLAKRLRFHLPIAFGLSFVAAIAFKVRTGLTLAFRKGFSSRAGFTWSIDQYQTDLRRSILIH